MRILYLSGFHCTLEFDQLSTLTELGHTWFSSGHYLDPKNPPEADNLRGPMLNIEPNYPLIEKFNKLNPNWAIHGPVYLDRELVDQFDLVIAEHCCPYPFFLRDNWSVLKHKPIIWRTYGQQNSQVELMTKYFKENGNVKLVRVSKNESAMENFAGVDKIIRGFVDEDRYNNWNGSENTVLTFNNFFNKRAYHSNTPTYLRLKEKFKNFKLYGLYNNDTPINCGVLSAADQEKAYRDCKVYFCLGSKPAPVTYNFAEALMTGCPVVTFGPILGNGSPSMYEIPDMVENGKEALYSDYEDELEDHIRLLLTDNKLAKEISINARNKALTLFSKKLNKQLWEEIINETID